MSKLLINKIPLWKGQTQKGVRYTPDILEKLIHDINFNKQTYDEIISGEISDNFVNTSEDIQKNIYYHGRSLTMKYNQGDFLINLGGDHAISMGTVPLMVLLYPDIKVVWIDAHADINSPETTLSGNKHGMPVHFMSELSGTSTYNKLKLDQLCYYGIRDLDPPEKEIISKCSIKNFTTNDIKSDRNKIIDNIDEWIGESPVHLSLDVDALDPSIFPSTGVPAENGLSIDDILLLCERIKEKKLVSMDFVEFNPEIGTEDEVTKSLNNARVIFEKFV